MIERKLSQGQEGGHNFWADGLGRVKIFLDKNLGKSHISGPSFFNFFIPVPLSN